eukprot:SAG11_NODE_8447_length_1014_cov_5.185792_2_plen_184_part_00
MGGGAVAQDEIRTQREQEQELGDPIGSVGSLPGVDSNMSMHSLVPPPDGVPEPDPEVERTIANILASRYANEEEDSVPTVANEEEDSVPTVANDTMTKHELRTAIAELDRKGFKSIQVALAKHCGVDVSAPSTWQRVGPFVPQKHVAKVKAFFRNPEKCYKECGVVGRSMPVAMMSAKLLRNR